MDFKRKMSTFLVSYFSTLLNPNDTNSVFKQKRDRTSCFSREYLNAINQLEENTSIKFSRNASSGIPSRSIENSAFATKSITTSDYLKVFWLFTLPKIATIKILTLTGLLNLEEYTPRMNRVYF